MDLKIPLRPARRLGGALLALALLAMLAPPANASPHGEEPLFASAWRLLSALWAETGLEADPSGQPAEVGFEVGPSGGRQPLVLFGQEGFVVDPSGFAAPAPPPANAGFVVDPNG